MIKERSHIKEEEFKKLEVLSAFAVYKKYGEDALLETYPEHVYFILANKNLSFQDFSILVQTLYTN